MPWDADSVKLDAQVYTSLDRLNIHMRTLTRKRQITYALAMPLVRLILRSLWATYRIEYIRGEEPLQQIAATAKPVIPCYWHQHHFICAQYLRRFIPRGIKLGFLISPSVDGEVPARIAQRWGAQVIRGSTTRTGAQAMRDMYNLIVKQKVSPVTTSDGPQGPLHIFKIGDILLAQLTQAPLLPLSYAADRYWQLHSWDHFMIPKPFARIAICVGQPYAVAKGIPAEDLEPQRQAMQTALLALQQDAQRLLQSKPTAGA